jgi:putative flippase GtrA
VRLEEKGRGRALHAVWSESDAQVLAYMDVDLSTDLAALLPLVAPLLSGHSDLAIGSRLSRGARVVRGPKREVISRCYNALLHVVLRARFSDAQCGFKAIRADCARELLPLVRDRAWFFDTELLVLAERAGLRIYEVPVDWVDDPDSRVDIVATALADLRGVVRLTRDLKANRAALDLVSRRRDGVPGFGGQVLRFAGIGVISTLAYTLLYLALRSVLPAQGANAVALLATAIGNTAANRRLTFAIRGTGNRIRHQAQGLVVFGLALGVTSLSLVALHALSAAPSRTVELVVLVAANLVATILRFVLFRSWVFRARRAAPDRDAPEAHWSEP